MSVGRWQKDDMYLLSTMISVLHGMIDNTEKLQSMLLFKLAVELDIMARILASAVDKEPVQLERICWFCKERYYISVSYKNVCTINTWIMHTAFSNITADGIQSLTKRYLKPVKLQVNRSGTRIAWGPACLPIFFAGMEIGVVIHTMHEVIYYG